MKSFLPFLQKRYTTKAYDPAQRLENETIKELLEVLRLSPSSINSQPWHFTLVEDPDLKRRLSEVSMHNTEKVLNCSHLIVFSIYDKIADFELERVNGLTVESYYRERLLPLGEGVVKDWMARQAYIALGTLLSACAYMEVDSTPMEGIDKDAYTQILGDEKHEVLFAVALGVRDREDKNQLHFVPKRRKELSELISKR